MNLNFTLGSSLLIKSFSGCRYEQLDTDIHCENSVPLNSELIESTTLEECEANCSERDDCSAATETYSYGTGNFKCYLHISTCDDPKYVDFGKDYLEDAGTMYKKICPQGTFSFRIQ